MKKFLAVLLVALVAVTAVFAADATITLKNTVAGTLPAVTVKYGSEENLLAAVSTKDDVVGNLNEVGGTRYFAVELVGNWASDKNWEITIETEPFMLYDANFTNKLTPNNGSYKVPTTFTMTGTDYKVGEKTLATSSYADGKLSVGYKEYSNISTAKVVARGTLTWDKVADLVAGNYKSDVKITVSDK